MTYFTNKFLTIFDDVEDLIFQRPFKDMNPITWKQTEDGYTGYVLTTGIRPEDVNISVQNGYIKVFGKTKHEDFDQEFSQSFSVRVNPAVHDNIEEVTYSSKDGVTKINIKVRKTDEKIKIKRL